MILISYISGPINGKMEFNLDPTKQATEVLFSCKKSTPNHPHLIFDGIVGERVNEQNI